MKSMRRLIVRAALGCVAAMSFSVTASAGQIITFIHEGSGRGTLDGNQFGANGFTITATGDIGDRTNFGNGWSLEHLSASITINGVGTFDFISPTRTFVNNGATIVGFSRGNDGSDLFNGPINAAFGAWDMTTSIGPIAGDGNLLQWGGGDIMTTGGVLIFDDMASPATFTAIIPAPGALAVLSLGAIAARRRRRSA